MQMAESLMEMDGPKQPSYFVWSMFNFIYSLNSDAGVCLLKH